MDPDIRRFLVGGRAGEAAYTFWRTRSSAHDEKPTISVSSLLPSGLPKDVASWEIP